MAESRGGAGPEWPTWLPASTPTSRTCTSSATGVRASGNHAIYLWTFTGTHATTGRELKVIGWEEWDLDDGGLIKRSLGNFDADDYARQVGL